MAMQNEVQQSGQKLENDSTYKPEIPGPIYHPGYWLTWTGLAVLTLIGRLPRKVALRIGSVMGDWFYYLNKKRRSIARTNLELCFPHWPLEKRNNLLRDHFRIYGQVVVDLGMLWLAREKRLNDFIHISGMQHWQEAQSQNRPVILLTPHMVGTDLTGTLLARDIPACTMMQELRNPLSNRLVASGRARFGLKVYSRSQGIRKLIRNLQQNVACIYIPDEDFGERNSVFVPFLGTVSATLTTLGRLAKLTNAIVLPFRTKFDGRTGHYYASIEKPLENFPTGNEANDARRMNAVFEEIIQQAPEQYMWTLRWFKTRPDNGSDLY